MTKKADYSHSFKNFFKFGIYRDTYYIDKVEFPFTKQSYNTIQIIKNIYNLGFDKALNNLEETEENKKIVNNFKNKKITKQVNSINEIIFNSDCYNHQTRYSVNLKDWANQICSEFKNVLSQKITNLDLNIQDYNSFEYFNKSLYQDMIDTTQELKFCLFINDKHIIERYFIVKNFNPYTLYSNNFIYLIEDWVYRIKERIKSQDEKQMWNEFELINKGIFNQKLTKEQIVNYQDKIDYYWLMSNKNIEWDKELFQLVKEKWNTTDIKFEEHPKYKEIFNKVLV